MYYLICLIANWKKNLDSNKIVGAVFMNFYQKLFIAYLMIY